MKKKPQKPNLRQQAASLREMGFNVSYGKKDSFSPQAKAALSRAQKKIAKYTQNKKQEFIWMPANKSQLKEVKLGLGKNVLTPKGFFLRKPKGSRGKPTLRFLERGKLVFTSRGIRGGKVTETIYRIDPRLLMEDPPRAILALGKKKDKVILTVNGFDSSQTVEYTLDALAYYLALDLLPKFLDPNLDAQYTKIHGKRKGTKKQKLEQFSNIFHVKVIRHTKEKNGTRRKGVPSKNRISKASSKRRKKR